MGTLLMRAGRLIMRAGRLVYTTCAACCSSCANIRRYNACPLPPNLQFCASDLGHVWVCDRNPLQCPDGIHYANQCWTPTDIVIPIRQKPPQDILIQDPVCSPGCSDTLNPCTVCNLYYPVQWCPNAPPPDPPLYVAVSRVFGCMFLGQGSCYFVTDSSTPVILPSNGAVYPATSPLFSGGTCCDGCLPDCNTTTQFIPICPSHGVERFNNCCCSGDYTLNTSVSFRLVSRADEVGVHTLDTHTYAGSVTRVFRNGQQVSPTRPVRFILHTIHAVNGVVLSRDDSLMIEPPRWSCGSPPQFWMPEGGAAVCFEDYGYDPALGPIASSIVATCNTLTATGSATQIQLDGIDRFTVTVQLTQSVSSQGMCSGGCGQGNVLGTPGTPSPAMAVPPEQWPAWANQIAGSRQPGDLGVGDTFARQLGKAGETFKAGFKRLFGRDCGCDARQEAWNRLYPYAAT